MPERNRLVKHPRAQGERGSRIRGCGCLIAMLLGIGCCCAAAAAEKDIEITVVTPRAVPRPAPETAPGGTVVLRGSPVSSNASPPAPGRNGDAYYRPVSSLSPAGWDRNYDTTGIDRRSDRNYDATGFDWGFNRIGLTRP
jgi:hypothetical protein